VSENGLPSTWSWPAFCNSSPRW